MAGKASGKHYTSKGERRNVSKEICKAMRSDYVGSLDQMINKINAWKRGKRVILTIPNPNGNELNKRFIRVPADKVWGNYKEKMKMFNASANKSNKTSAE